jgi:hypothetical protein
MLRIELHGKVNWTWVYVDVQGYYVFTSVLFILYLRIKKMQVASYSSFEYWKITRLLLRGAVWPGSQLPWMLGSWTSLAGEKWSFKQRTKKGTFTELCANKNELPKKVSELPKIYYPFQMIFSGYSKRISIVDKREVSHKKYRLQSIEWFWTKLNFW